MRKSLFGLAVSFIFAISVAGQGPGAQTSRALPDGNGKAIVDAACTTCHAANMITDAGHTAEDWKLLVERMVSAGADVPQNQTAAVTEYLAKNFPESNVPPAVIVPGPMKISFKEWTAPTKGSRPHDPLATHDGYLWYSGQYASVLGRVDTKTGEIKEFRPPMPRSGPHGLVEDKDGNIWFTANSKGYIGKLDPKIRQVHRVQASCRGERSSHPAVRPEGHALVHGSGCKPRRQARYENRRRQGGDVPDERITSLWHGRRYKGNTLLL